MQSCIYEGRVRHRRFAPVENMFRYRLFMMYLDLAELPGLFDEYSLWSPERPNLAHFRRRDHLGAAEIPLDQSVREVVRQQTGNSVDGPIRLLTHLRYFGFRFNPVSFFLCFDRQGREVETIVGEVNNTPWGEQHPYVLSEALNLGTARKKCYRFAKAFHVSPFMSMEQEYTWYFTTPGRSLAIQMENREAQNRFFDATLTMRRTEISARSLSRVLLQYPLMTARVVAAIHWQALRLYLKKCPFYPHPKWQAVETQS